MDGSAGKEKKKKDLRMMATTTTRLWKINKLNSFFAVLCEWFVLLCFNLSALAAVLVKVALLILS